VAYFFGPPCRYLHQTAEEFHQSSADEARQRLRSAFTSSLVVPRTRLSTIGDRALPVVPALLWSILLLNVTSISVFRKHMKTHHFIILFPNLLWCLRNDVVISDTMIDLLLTYIAASAAVTSLSRDHNWIACQHGSATFFAMVQRSRSTQRQRNPLPLGWVQTLNTEIRLTGSRNTSIADAIDQTICRIRGQAVNRRSRNWKW